MPLLAGRRDWQLVILVGPHRERAAAPRARGAPAAALGAPPRPADDPPRREPRRRRRRLPVAALARAAQVAAQVAARGRGRRPDVRERARGGRRGARALRADPGDRERSAGSRRRASASARARCARSTRRCCRGCARSASSGRSSRAIGERDVGYILGAVMAGEYRGLQFSYDDELRQARHRRPAPVPADRRAVRRRRRAATTSAPRWTTSGAGPRRSWRPRCSCSCGDQSWPGLIAASRFVAMIDASTPIADDAGDREQRDQVRGRTTCARSSSRRCRSAARRART